jgi:hypothetical protein
MQGQGAAVHWQMRKGCYWSVEGRLGQWFGWVGSAVVFVAARDE